MVVDDVVNKGGSLIIIDEEYDYNKFPESSQPLIVEIFDDHVEFPSKLNK